MSYPDTFDDYAGFLAPRLEEARRLLTESGTLYVHLDWREAHYCKVLLDEIFGRDCFLNEVIWAYDFGGRAQGPLAGQARHDPGLRQAAWARTCSTRTRSSGCPTSRRGWSARRRPRAASCRPTCGGTRSCRPAARRRPATRPRSPRACCAGCCSRRRGRGTGCWTSSPAAVRRARWPPRSGRRFVLVDENPQAVEVMRARLPHGDGVPRRRGRTPPGAVTFAVVARLHRVDMLA